jgi:6-phosphogluconolactonase
MRTPIALLTVAFLAAGCSETDFLSPTGPSKALGLSSPGAVYLMSNGAGGNAVIAFDRSSDGTLSPAGEIPTGGTGAGAGLGSQGSIILTEDGRWLLAVNAGSNDVSVFRVSPTGLELTDVEDSGGVMPISVTAYRSLVYVLNAGDGGNISGFSLSPQGDLAPLAGSTRPLSGAATGPAQVEFSPDGAFLVVTEKMTNLILTYAVDAGGIAGAPVAHPSAGTTPFGFGFSGRNRLIVSEAFGGAADASSTSSYLLERDGSLTSVSPSVATTETAACWVTISRNGRFAYVTNTGSGSVSGYAIAPDGSLTLLDADGVTGVTGGGSAPSDEDFSVDGRFLYTRNGNQTISAFAYSSDGGLTALGTTAGIPAGAVGLAAR